MKSFNSWDWLFKPAFVVVPLQTIAAKWIESFKKFLPRHKPASFTLDEVMEGMVTAGPNNELSYHVTAER